MWMYGGGYWDGQTQQLLDTLHATNGPLGWEYRGQYHTLLTSEVDRYSESYLQENTETRQQKLDNADNCDVWIISIYNQTALIQFPRSTRWMLIQRNLRSWRLLKGEDSSFWRETCEVSHV
jgi:hypothetical protein